MSFHKRGIGVLILALLGLGMRLYAQPAQLDFRHFDTDDGLPSSETYTIIEDRSGYIWIGTDNGVARFDGYEFEVFDADDGLEDMVVFGIVEDDKGRIWISTHSGKIYFFKSGRFHPYVHSAVVEKAKSLNRIGVLLDVTPDESLLLGFQYGGILKVNSAGGSEWVVKKVLRNIYLYERNEGGRLTSCPQPHGFYHRNSASIEDNLGIYLVNQDGKQRAYGKSKSYAVGSARSTFSAVFNANGKKESVITNRNLINILNEDGSFKHTYLASSSHYTYFMPGLEEETYWAFLSHGGGLEYHDFRANQEVPIISHQLRGQSLSSGLQDRNGGFWVTTLSAGVFYSPYPKQLVYQKNNEMQSGGSLSVVITGSNDFYAGYENGTIFHYGNDSQSLQPIQSDEIIMPHQIFDMHYDSVTARVFSPSYSFTHPVKGGEKLRASSVSWFKEANGNRGWFRYFNEQYDEDPRKIYASNVDYISIIDIDSPDIVEVGMDSRHIQELVHVYSPHPSGIQLAGTLTGLWEIKKDRTMVPNNLGIPELSNQIDFIKDLGNDNLLFGTRGNGLVYVGLDTNYLIQERDGLASDMIRDLHISDNGTIWVSTLNGLSRLNFKNGGKEYQVRTFRKEHGLPSEEIYQTDTYKDEVWLATGAGIVKFEAPAVVTLSPPPVIRRIVLNGDELPDSTSYTFPPGVNNVSISFSTINFILGDKVLYRYRLTKSDAWQIGTERTANYPNLSPGSYRFEVQSKNQDGIWSESIALEIVVATPWYNTIWAQIGGILLIIGVLSGFFLLRERRRKREQDLLLQITQMEHAALHAQMNPHFVFNALNSIQNFVLENDARQAATYLSRFARVIRQTLRSSVDGQHHLNEELMMLETYLGLEKLRFKEGFSYTVEVDPTLPKDEVILPPLLIQPFVENAILHGLKDRKRGGRILLRFTGTADNLIVIIEDNGKGYDPGEEIKPDSLGMNITRRRLDMMNQGKDGVSGMEIIPLFSHDGTPVGTRVTLFIRPLTDATNASV